MEYALTFALSSSEILRTCKAEKNYIDIDIDIDVMLIQMLEYM